MKDVRTMQLKSNDFVNGGMIPTKFACDGRDLSPHLEWSEVPEGTRSFALIVDDPDAPMGTWVHWLLCDIPSNVTEIPQNSVPREANQVNNDFGKKDYGGPCPPGGVHRYFFKLYALNVRTLGAVMLNKKSFYSKVEEHKIAEAVLMGRYTRGI